MIAESYGKLMFSSDTGSQTIPTIFFFFGLMMNPNSHRHLTNSVIVNLSLIGPEFILKMIIFEFFFQTLRTFQ